MIRIDEQEFSDEIREKIKKTRISDIILLAGAMVIVWGLTFQEQDKLLASVICLAGIMVIVYARFLYKKAWVCEGCSGKLPWLAYMKTMTNCTNCGRTFITDEKRHRLEALGEIEREKKPAKEKD